MANDNLPWMESAISLIGTDEFSGGANNPKILAWARYVDLQRDYNADSIPWCGLFVAYNVAQAGMEPVDQPLWARNWAKFGTKLEQGAYGAILVFVRDGGGHVGFYVSEDSSTYHVLGGNQSDSVNITRVAKDRCIAIRWPPGMLGRLKKGRIVKNFTGRISTNEA